MRGCMKNLLWICHEIKKNRWKMGCCKIITCSNENLHSHFTKESYWKYTLCCAATSRVLDAEVGTICPEACNRVAFSVEPSATFLSEHAVSRMLRRHDSTDLKKKWVVVVCCTRCCWSQVSDFSCYWRQLLLPLTHVSQLLTCFHPIPFRH